MSCDPSKCHPFLPEAGRFLPGFTSSLRGNGQCIPKIPHGSLLLVVIFLILLSIIPNSSHAEIRIVINEVQSSNSSTISDEDGDFEDWIELYNAGSDTVWLHGYGLSDDAAQLWRWVFPEGVHVAPNDFLLVWASGKDRRVPDQPLHTNFSIRSEGEEVLLSSFTIPDGGHSPIIDKLDPTPIPTDYSFGRYPDGSENRQLFASPTPGTPNQESSYQGVAETPVFSRKPGFYTDAFDLIIHAGHPDAVLHYTLDGSVPTTDSPVFETRIAIDRRDHEPNVLSNIRTGPQFWVPPAEPVFKGHVVRAIAVQEGMRQSETATGTWFVHPEGQNRYSFPVISINADPEHFFSDETGIMVPGDTYDPENFVYSGNYNQRGEEWERPANLTFFDNQADPFVHHRSQDRHLPAGMHSNRAITLDHPDHPDHPDHGFSQNVGIRIHGGSTRRYPQKSLRIYARSIYDWQSDITWPLFPGLSKAGTGEPLETWKRLILRSSGNDWFHTMFKDAMIQSLYADRRVDYQAYRPAVVFINGEYWGIHNIRERLDGWYLQTHYDIHRDDVVILDFNAIVSHGHLSDREHYLQMRDFSRDQDLSDSTNFSFMESWMDMDNYLAYKTFLVYTANTDWPHNNIRYWRKRTDDYVRDAPCGSDGRWRWMIYDLDASFGHPYQGDNSWWAQYDQDTLEWITGTGNPRMPAEWVNMLFNGLIENEGFRNRFISLLAGDLNTRFHPRFVTGRIEEFREVYRPEIEEHILRYPNSAGRDLAGWENQIEVMMEFARKRPAYLRTFIMKHFDIPDTVNLQVNLTEPGRGFVRINDIAIHRNTPGVPEDYTQWEGTCFFGIPVTLTAVPAEGYRFVEWQNSHGEPFDFNGISVKETADHQNSTFIWLPDGDLNVTALFEQMEITSSDDGRHEGPAAFSLFQNYPNPFNHQTVISYELATRAEVTFTIYTVDGRKIRSYFKGFREAGRHEFRLEMPGLASGLYLYSLRIRPGTEHGITLPPRKMMLIR